MPRRPRKVKRLNTPRLRNIDLMKCCRLGVFGKRFSDHPDIRPDGEYLAMIGGAFFAGSFVEDHMGWTFKGWHGATLPLDKPGTNASTWLGLWEIIRPGVKLKPLPIGSKNGSQRDRAMWMRTLEGYAYIRGETSTRIGRERIGVRFFSDKKVLFAQQRDEARNFPRRLRVVRIQISRKPLKFIDPDEDE